MVQNKCIPERIFRKVDFEEKISRQQKSMQNYLVGKELILSLGIHSLLVTVTQMKNHPRGYSTQVV